MSEQTQMEPVNPPAQTQPQPAAPPQQQAPAKAPAQEPARPELTADTILTFSGPDGSQMRKTIGELIDASMRPSTPGIDPEQLKQFEIWQRASQNDPEAIGQLLDGVRSKLAPQARAPEPGTPEHELSEMKKQLEAMQAELKQASSTTMQINLQRGRNWINDQVKRVAAEVPYLSRLTDPASVVTRHLVDVKRAYEAQGIDLQTNQQNQIQAMSHAMNLAEKELAGYAQVFGAQPANGQAKPIVNDQGARPAAPVGPPPGYSVWTDGSLRDQQGRILQQQSHGAIAPVDPNGTVPGQIPGVPAGGSPVGLPPQPTGQPGNQRFNVGSLAQRMRQRQNELAQAAQ